MEVAFFLRHVDRLLLALLMAVPRTSAYIRHHRCYNCMSTFYKELFDDPSTNWDRYFYRPRNFTNDCNEPIDSRSEIGFQFCRTICLTLVQELEVLGKPTGRKLVMRGCSDGINKFGFYNKTMQYFDRYDVCRTIKASDLFREEASSASIFVCSCLGDKCNGISVSAARTNLLSTDQNVFSRTMPVLFAAILMVNMIADQI